MRRVAPYKSMDDLIIKNSKLFSLLVSKYSDPLDLLHTLEVIIFVILRVRGKYDATVSMTGLSFMYHVWPSEYCILWCFYTCCHWIIEKISWTCIRCHRKNLNEILASVAVGISCVGPLGGKQASPILTVPLNLAVSFFPVLSLSLIIVGFVSYSIISSCWFIFSLLLRIK